MRVSFYAGVKYDNKVFFSGYYWLTGLFSMNIENGEVKFLKLFEKEILTSRLHRMAFLYQNEAWFIPEQADYIACLDINTLEISYYEIPCYKKNPVIGNRDYCVYVSGYVLKGKFLCLIPREIDTALIIDMEKHELYPYYCVINPEKDRIADGVVLKEVLYLLPENGKNYIKIDLQSGKHTVAMRIDGELVPASIYNIKGKIWSVECFGKCISYMDITSGEIVRLKLLKSENRYYGMTCMGSKIVFLPLKADCFFIIDMDSLAVEVIKPNGDEEIFGKGVCRTSVIGSLGETLIAVGATGNIAVLNENSMDCKVIPVDITVDNLFKQIIQYIKKYEWLKDRGLDLINIVLKQLDIYNFRVLYEQEWVAVLTQFIGIRGLLDKRIVFDKDFSQDGIEIIGKRIWNKIIKGNT